VRFYEGDVRPMGRSTEGVRGMRLRAGDEVIELTIAPDEADLLIVTENGFGKRTRISEYRRTGRGGLGVKTVQLTEARGQLVGARVVRDGLHVMLISTYGTVIRMPVEDFKRLGRATQGVTVMRLRGDDEHVSSLALVAEAEGPSEGEEPALEPVPEPGEEPLTSAAEPLEPPLDGLDIA
jgi:DNA gyrase subunit A